MTRLWSFLGWSFFWCALVIASPFLIPMEACFRLAHYEADEEWAW